MVTLEYRVSPKVLAHMAILVVIVCRIPVKLVVLKRIQVPVKNPVHAVAVLGCLWIVEFGGNGNREISSFGIMACLTVDYLAFSRYAIKPTGLRHWISVFL